MLTFKNFVSMSILAASAATVALAAPTMKRQTPDTCSYFANAALAVRPKGSNGSIAPTWVGIVSGVTHDGIDGQQASILVTKDDNGNALQPQQWEFDHCTSLDGHPLPPDYVAPNNTIS